MALPLNIQTYLDSPSYYLNVRRRSFEDREEEQAYNQKVCIV